MAERGTLHPSHLPEFQAWLESQGWRAEPSPAGNGYEVLRVRHAGHRQPVIFYRRDAPSQHLTSFGAGSRLVSRFIRLRAERRKACLREAAVIEFAGAGEERDVKTLRPTTQQRIARGIANYLRHG